MTDRTDPFIDELRALGARPLAKSEKPLFRRNGGTTSPDSPQITFMPLTLHRPANFTIVRGIAARTARPNARGRMHRPPHVYPTRSLTRVPRAKFGTWHPSLPLSIAVPAMPNSPNTTAEQLQLAEKINLYSQVTGPLKSLTFFQRSLLMAELSMLAYLPPDKASLAVQKIGFRESMFFNQKGAQAYWFQSPWDAVIVCRGTEPHDWYDIRANVNLWMEVAETVGKVHRGFKREMDRLWPRLEQALVRNRQPLWFTGHSLGGAMATICAGRCKMSYIKSNPEELYTYGSPRVGNQSYVQFTRLRHHRWVNNNDIVPTVPPTWLGYRHCGQEWYLNFAGQLRKLTWSGRVHDSWQGLREAWTKRRFDFVADHSMFDYIVAIRHLCAEERRQAAAEAAAQAAAEAARQAGESTAAATSSLVGQLTAGLGIGLAAATHCLQAVLSTRTDTPHLPASATDPTQLDLQTDFPAENPVEVDLTASVDTPSAAAVEPLRRAA